MILDFLDIFEDVDVEWSEEKASSYCSCSCQNYGPESLSILSRIFIFMMTMAGEIVILALGVLKALITSHRISLLRHLFPHRVVDFASGSVSSQVSSRLT